MFLTQEKVLKRINQDRQKGDLNRACRRAMEGLERWPDDYDLLLEAVQLCFDLSDYQQAVKLLKSAIRRHPENRSQLLKYAHEMFRISFNPFLGSFIIEALLRSRNIEGVRDILRISPESFVQDLIRRSETRSKGLSEGERIDPSVHTDNEILLGLLYMQDNQYEKAAAPLGKALENLPEEAKVIGCVIVELEREIPDCAETKFYLGLASTLLSHPDKAEMRFFQCLGLKNPPLEKVSSILESIEEPSKNHTLLKGETLIRHGKAGEGVSLIRDFLSKEDSGWEPKSKAEDIKQFFPGHIDRKEMAFERLTLLLDGFSGDPEVVFLYCDIAADLEKVKTAVDKLEKLCGENGESQHGIINWIEGNERISITAPAQKLLTKLFLESGDFSRASRAARMTSEIDKSEIPALSRMIEDRIAEAPGNNPELRLILAELKARIGDRESAEGILGDLRSENSIADSELFRITGEIMRRCGVSISGVISSIDISVRNGNAPESLAYIVEFLREHTDEHCELAGAIKRLGEENESFWPDIAGLVDSLAKEEQLSKPFKLLQAYSHLQKGEVERAVFEYDQILMSSDEIRFDLIRTYETAARQYCDNTTLNLALYQLHLEEDQLTEAAHYLCRTLELDPEQIRDVLERFNNLVEKDPTNKGIWEEMLKTSLAMNHLDLAKEILKRAVSVLPEDEAAPLHVYGAMVSNTEGKTEDSLRCLAVALTSPHTDLESVDEELKNIITREPANPEANYLLGEVLVSLGKEEEAIPVFQRCLELSPAYQKKMKERLEKLLPISIKPWLISRILGEIAWDEERFEDAYLFFATCQKGPKESLPELSSTLMRLQEAAPDDRHLELLYARNLFLEEQYREAVEILEKIVTGADGPTKSAMDILLELLEAEPAQLEANRLLARIMIDTGQADRSLEPVLRLLSISSAAPAHLDEVVSEFLGIHEKDSRFLVPYARLKAKNNESGKALMRYREALEIDRASWERILTELDSISWPADLSCASRLLKVDCLLAGGRADVASRLIKEFPTVDPVMVEEIVQRICTLIERKPVKELFSFGSQLLAGSGNVEKAEELIKQGCGLIDDDEGVDLKIEFAEILEGSGLIGKAASIFEEVLAGANDRKKILKRIEKAFTGWADLEVASGLNRLDGESSSEDDAARLIRLSLDINQPDTALKMIKKCRISEIMRSVLLSRTYLCMERPYLSLAAASAVPAGESAPGDLVRELLYMQGIASERIGDYGRAAAAFSRVTGIHGGYLDSDSRAEKNYVKFLETEFENTAEVLEKTGNLNIGFREGEDES